MDDNWLSVHVNQNIASREESEIVMFVNLT